MEFERLIAYFEGDITGFEKSAEKVSKLIDGIERKLKTAGGSLNIKASQPISTLNAIGKTIESVGKKLKSVGGELNSLGSTLSTAVSLSLTAIGAASIKAASSLDNLQNKLTAATGSTGGAANKLRELQELAATSAGVLVKFASETYSMLKPMKIGEKVIDDFTKALGRIKMQNPELDTSQFSRNLTQLFSQNFELTDLKEAVGAFPRIGEILQKAFSLKGSDLSTVQEGMKELKKSGKLTLESFYEGVAEGVNNDSSLSLLTDTISIRFAKAFERLSIAIAPLGMAILNVIEPIIPPIVALIETLGEKFTALSPMTQTIIVAFGGIAAAAGPVLIVLGTLAGAVSSIIAVGGTLFAVISTVASGIGAFLSLVGAAGLTATLSAIVTVVGGTLVSAFTALAPVILPVIGIIAAVGAVVVAAVAAVAGAVIAWKTNFGAIRDFTVEVWNIVKTVTETAMREIYGFVSEIGGSIIGWWRENYPQIRETVRNVSDAVQALIRVFLNTVYAFWKQHGEQIMEIVRFIWETVKTIIRGAVSLTGSVIKLAMQLINADWSGAWQTFLEITRNASRLVLQINKAMGDLILRILASLIPIILRYWVKFNDELLKIIGKAAAGVIYILATLPDQIIRLIPTFIKAGSQIGSAIWEGIKQGLSQGSAAAGNLGLSSGIGANLGLGDGQPVDAGAGFGEGVKNFNGLGDAAGKAGKKVKEVLSPIEELRKQLKDASEEFNFFNSNLEAQGMVGKISRIQDYTAKIKELLSVRAEFGLNEQFAVPDSLDAVSAEIDAISAHGDGLQSAIDMLKTFEDTIRGIGDEKTNLEKVNNLIKDERRNLLIIEETAALLKQKAILADAAVATRNFTAEKATLMNQMIGERFNLADQVKLFDVTDKYQQQLIKNSIDRQRYEHQLRTSEKKFSEEKIRELMVIRDAEMERTAELQKQISLQEKLKASLGFIEELLAKANISISGFGGKESNVDKLNKMLGDPAILIDLIDKANAAKMTFEDFLKVLTKTAIQADQGLETRPRIVPTDDTLSIWDRIVEGIKGKIRSIQKELPSFSQSVANSFESLLNGVGGVVVNAFQNFDGTIKGFFKSVILGFADLVKQIIAEWLKVQLIKGITSLLTSVLGGAAGGAFGGGGGGADGSSIIGWGAGGSFAAGGLPPVNKFSLVGERGPELFIPKVGGRILSNEESRAALSGSGASGQTIVNNNFNQTINAPRGLIAKKSARQLANETTSSISAVMKGFESKR